MKRVLPVLQRFFTFYLLSLAGTGIFVFLGGVMMREHPLRIIPAAAVPIAVLICVLWTQHEKITDLEERLRILEQKRRDT